MADDPRAGVRLYVGVSGSGKSYDMKRDTCDAVRSDLPTVVIDLAEEWNSVPHDLAKVTTGNLARFAQRRDPRNIVAANIEDAVKAGARLVVWRQTDGWSPDRMAEVACTWAYKRDGPAGVSIPEAHNVAPKWLSPETFLMRCVTAWRHRDVSLRCDTQRFALINTTLIEQAREIKLFAIVGRNDRAVVREIDGSEDGRQLEALVREAGLRLRDADPGWHVTLDQSRLPPYELVKRSPEGLILRR